MLEQLRRQGDIIVEGGSRDPAWTLEGYAALLRDPRLHATRHVWCQSGVVDPDTALPVHTCTLLLSTLALPDRSKCVCVDPPMHALRTMYAKNSSNLIMNIGFISDLVRNLGLPSLDRPRAVHPLISKGPPGDVPESSFRPSQSSLTSQTSSTLHSTPSTTSTRPTGSTHSDSTYQTNSLHATNGDKHDDKHDGNYVDNHAYPTEARERQKAQWKQQKELAEAKGERPRSLARSAPLQNSILMIAGRT